MSWQEELREAWVAKVTPEDYETHMRNIGQAQANALLSRELIVAHPPQRTVWIPGAGTGQMFDFVSPEFLATYEVTFSDVSRRFLDVLATRIPDACLIEDDLLATKLQGPFDGTLLVLVLEHIDWRIALPAIASRTSDLLWIIIQRNPSDMASAVTPGRIIPPSIAQLTVGPKLVDEAELTAVLDTLEFTLEARQPRPVADGKEMVGLVFRRRRAT